MGSAGACRDLLLLLGADEAALFVGAINRGEKTSPPFTEISFSSDVEGGNGSTSSREGLLLLSTDATTLLVGTVNVA